MITHERLAGLVDELDELSGEIGYNGEYASESMRATHLDLKVVIYGSLGTWPGACRHRDCEGGPKPATHYSPRHGMGACDACAANFNRGCLKPPFLPWREVYAAACARLGVPPEPDPDEKP
jgi:hypothetical protein